MKRVACFVLVVFVVFAVFFLVGCDDPYANTSTSPSSSNDDKPLFDWGWGFNIATGEYGIGYGTDGLNIFGIP